jgi:hypothetical protein
MALRLQVLFGGASRQFGWLFGTLGMVFCLVSLPLVEWPFDDHDRAAPGEVVAVDETSTEVNDRPVYAVDARFVDHRGRARTVRSYTSSPPATGARVEVAYDGSDPADAKIDGMRKRRLPWWLGPIVMLFPVVGVVIALRQLRRARRDLRLLGVGRTARGHVVGTRPGKVKINNTPETIVELEYETEHGRRHRFEVHTFRPHALQDDRDELVFYDPRWPDHATTLDHLPGSPTLRADGTLHATGSAVVPLLLPLAAAGLALATIVRVIVA